MTEHAAAARSGGAIASAVMSGAIIAALLGAPVEARRSASIEQAHQPAVEEAHGVPAEATHGEDAEHGSGVWGTIARLVNFAILAGTLVYFLRSPAAAHFRDRVETVRHDLVTAAEMRATAQAQLDEIARRMDALPGELEALKARGAEEIRTEAARIRQSAAAERDRLLEQTRRDIDLQLRAARRELTSHAGALAVRLATDRLRQSMTPDDQARLLDRYLENLGGEARA